MIVTELERELPSMVIEQQKELWQFSDRDRASMVIEQQKGSWQFSDRDRAKARAMYLARF